MLCAFVSGPHLGGTDANHCAIDLALIGGIETFGAEQISADHAPKPAYISWLRSRTRRCR